MQCQARNDLQRGLTWQNSAEKLWLLSRGAFAIQNGLQSVHSTCRGRWQSPASQSLALARPVSVVTDNKGQANTTLTLPHANVMVDALFM